METYLHTFKKWTVSPSFDEMDIFDSMKKAENLHNYGIPKYLTPCSVVNTILPDIIELLDSSCDVEFINHSISSMISIFYDFPGLMKSSLDFMIPRIQKVPFSGLYCPVIQGAVINHMRWLSWVCTVIDSEYDFPMVFIERPTEYYHQYSFVSPDPEVVQCYECNVDDCTGHSVYFHWHISLNAK